MAATTFTPVSEAVTTATPRPHARARTAKALRAIRAFGGAAVSVALLGDYGPPEAGVRDPRPARVR
ncbi:hypothetical protein AB0G79_03805 [Streptomyces sp. NPDC020807]|uniref:hypothetical protein n=1 Tax=Streptomyces sp. NPDC020807 TaxID=3155119 RepID=UPI0033DA5653